LSFWPNLARLKEDITGVHPGAVMSLGGQIIFTLETLLSGTSKRAFIVKSQ
jgi:hypothetical protein